MPRIPQITAQATDIANSRAPRTNPLGQVGAKTQLVGHPIGLLLGASLKETENERKRAVLDLLT